EHQRGREGVGGAALHGRRGGLVQHAVADRVNLRGGERAGDDHLIAGRRRGGGHDRRTDVQRVDDVEVPNWSAGRGERVDAAFFARDVDVGGRRGAAADRR